MQKISSIKNEIKNKRKYKVITFLGIKIKFRQKSYEIEQKINLLSKKIENQNKQQQEKLKKQENKLSKQNEKIENLRKSLEKYTLWQNNFYREIPLDFPALLSLDEKELLIKYFKNSKNYLEFGPGGSTFVALLNSNCNIVAVESDLDWVDYLRTYKYIHNNENNRLKFIYVDIGKIKSVGKPLNNEKREDYPNYSTGIYEKLNSKNFDLAFVDGRFRVACVLGIILNCSKDITIMVHDYSFREYYHVIEEFLDIIDNSETLYVFKIKNEINKNRVEELYEEYKYSFE